jgi:hypothetical protein
VAKRADTKSWTDTAKLERIRAVRRVIRLVEGLTAAFDEVADELAEVERGRRTWQAVGLRPPKACASQGGPRQRMLINVDPASGLCYATTNPPLIQHWWRDCVSEYQLWGALATGSA